MDTIDIFLERARQIARAEREYNAQKRAENEYRVARAEAQGIANAPVVVIYPRVGVDGRVVYHRADFGTRTGACRWTIFSRIDNAIFVPSLLATDDNETLYKQYR